MATAGRATAKPAAAPSPVTSRRRPSRMSGGRSNRRQRAGDPWPKVVTRHFRSRSGLAPLSVEGHRVLVRRGQSPDAKHTAERRTDPRRYWPMPATKTSAPIAAQSCTRRPKYGDCALDRRSSGSVPALTRSIPPMRAERNAATARIALLLCPFRRCRAFLTRATARAGARGSSPQRKRRRMRPSFAGACCRQRQTRTPARQ